MNNSLKRTRIELLLLFVMYIIIIPQSHHDWDFQCWQRWALDIYHQGLINVYSDTSVNYHPIYLYCLYLYDKVQGNEQNIIANINYIKIIPLFFDFLPIVLLCCFKRSKLNIQVPYYFLFFNIAYLYTTMFWGQVDSVYANLVFISLFIAFYAPVTAVAVFSLALCTKLQAIIYLPLLAMILLYSIDSVKKLLATAFCFVLTTIIVISPFIIYGKTNQLIHVVTTAVGFFPFLAQGAFNFWFLITKDAATINDDAIWHFISYKHAGQIFFSIASCIVLFPLLFRLLRLKITKDIIDNNTLQLFFLVAGLIPLFFFYFNTEMHERYAHPMIIFLFFYSILAGSYYLYILASASYLLNLNLLLISGLPFHNYPAIFNQRTTAIIYTATVAMGLFTFIRKFGLMKEFYLLKATLEKNKKRNITVVS